MEALKKHLAGASSSDRVALPERDTEYDTHDGALSHVGVQPVVLRKEELAARLFASILKLQTGEALLFAPSAIIGVNGKAREAPSSTGFRDAEIEEDEKEGVEVNNHSNRSLSHEEAGKGFENDAVIRLGSGVLRVRIRKRVTSDGGRSIMAG
jgi:hypothetical protein